MEKNQEIDLIDLLGKFLQKVYKYKFLVLLTVLVSIAIGFAVSKFQKEKFHMVLMVHTCLDNDVFCNLIQELNTKNVNGYEVSSKIDNLYADREEERSPQIFLSLNDTSGFAVVKEKIISLISNTPFVLEYIQKERGKLQKLINYLDIEIDKTEKLYAQLILHPDTRQSFYINFPKTLVYLKSLRLDYQEDIDNLIAIKFIGIGSSPYIQESKLPKILFLSFFLGILLSFFLVLIKKDENNK